MQLFFLLILLTSINSQCFVRKSTGEKYSFLKHIQEGRSYPTEIFVYSDTIFPSLELDRGMGASFYVNKYEDSLYYFGAHSTMYQYSFERNQYRFITNKTLDDEERVVSLNMYNKENRPRRMVGSAHFISSDGETLFMIGGWNSRKWKSYYDIWEFSVDLSKWRKVFAVDYTDYETETFWHLEESELNKYHEKNHPMPFYGNGKQMHEISENKFILFVGSRSPQGYQNQIWIYNTVLNQWKGISRIYNTDEYDFNDLGKANPKGVCDIYDTTIRPSARGDFSSWYTDGKLYIYGGQIVREVANKTAPDKIYLNDLWFWKNDSWCWIQGQIDQHEPGGLGITKASYFQTVQPEETIYLFGGYNGENSNNKMLRYDFVNNVFESIDGFIDVKKRHMAKTNVYSNGVVLFSGFGDETDDVYNDIWIFNKELCKNESSYFDDIDETLPDPDDEDDGDDFGASFIEGLNAPLIISLVSGLSLVFVCGCVVLLIIIVLIILNSNYKFLEKMKQTDDIQNAEKLTNIMDENIKEIKENLEIDDGYTVKADEVEIKDAKASFNNKEKEMGKRIFEQMPAAGMGGEFISTLPKRGVNFEVISGFKETKRLSAVSELDQSSEDFTDTESKIQELERKNEIEKNRNQLQEPTNNKWKEMPEIVKSNPREWTYSLDEKKERFLMDKKSVRVIMKVRKMRPSMKFKPKRKRPSKVSKVVERATIQRRR